MKKYSLQILVIFSLVLGLAGCSGGGGVTVADDLGREIGLEGGKATRIISLAPSITESLFVIGAGDLLVGRDDYSVYPPEAMDVPSVGTLWGGIPAEAILALNPDLVLVAEITSKEEVQAIEDLGLTVFWQENPHDFDGLYANLKELAALTGTEKQAKDVIEAFQSRVEAVIDLNESVTTTPLVFLELDATDPSNPYTTGNGTFIDMLIELAGGENLGDELEGEWVPISSEILIAADPDVILLADAEWGVSPESVAERAGYEVITAVVDGQIYPVSSYITSVPGPGMVEGLETLSQLIHPELY